MTGARREGFSVVTDAPLGTPRLCLLHAFDLQHDQRSIPVPAAAQRLLAYLALQRGPALRRAACAALWGDLDERAAAARLRSTLWRMPAPADLRLVETEGGRIRLAPEVEVDLHLAEDDNRVGELDLTQLCGDVLADWDEPWLEAERERIRQLRLHRIEQIADRALEDGRFHLALQAALTAASTEPLRESAHRQVMRVHLAEGNPAEALRQFDTVRMLLRDELGLPPAPATRAVVAPFLGRPLDARAS
jgi:DNA-binding SARP family transcriptional activator